jgi:hypothetical protein
MALATSEHATADIQHKAPFITLAIYQWQLGTSRVTARTVFLRNLYLKQALSFRISPACFRWSGPQILSFYQPAFRCLVSWNWMAF